MANGAFISMSSAIAVHKRLDIVANNLANVDTAGFKQSRLVFEHVYTKAKGRETTQEKGFVDAQHAELTLAQGRMERTGNPLDVALHGNGFLVLRDANNNPFLTRNGAMRLNDSGVLVDGAGRSVMLEGQDAGQQPLAISPQNGPLQINDSGEIVQGAAVLGKLQIVAVDPQQLQARGNATFYADPDTWQPAAETTRVLAGHLEGSNADALRNLTELININRSYSMVQKVIQQYSQTDRKAISTIV